MVLLENWNPLIFARHLGENFHAERDRWILWTPVFLGLGIGFYFLMPFEPPLWSGLSLVIGSLLTLTAVRNNRPTNQNGLTASLVPAFAVILVVAVGFSLGQWRSAHMAAPKLAADTGPITLAGTVAEIVDKPDRGTTRLLLISPEISGLSAAMTPRKIRVTVRKMPPDIAPGQRVRMRAVLRPPPGPVAPGAFDFARRAWFQQLGGIGFSIGSVTRIAKTDGGADYSIAELAGFRLADFRQYLETKIRLVLHGPPGAIAAALVTGRRGAIPESVLEDLRKSGLAHLLAISGLHMGLVAATIFFFVRMGLALAERWALRYPIKKIAALAALAGAFCYLFLSGGSVPTLRAFVMVGLVLIAILLDRRALSMRVVAWAATAILVVRPESIIDVGFQMSFSAVVALIAVYEGWTARRALQTAEQAEDRPQSSRLFKWSKVAALYLAGVTITSLVAGMATAPFAAYHFQRVALFGIAANLVAVPLMALWIMPLLILSLLVVPFGLEGLILPLAAAGIEIVMTVSATVADWPGSSRLISAFPLTVLLAATFGALWACLWRGSWRWGGGVAGLVVAIAILVSGGGRAADILINDKGSLVAVKDDHGRLALSSKVASKFVAGQWLRRNGQTDPEPWAAGQTGGGGENRLRCDSLGCLYKPDIAGVGTVALAFDPRALAEDCQIAEILIATVPVSENCASGTVIDRFDLWRKGGHAVYLSPDGPIIRTVSGYQGKRPWAVLRGPDASAARKAAARPD